ncbi:MAG: tRNA (adenosine(37)-N6)-dimethylallyltransferase MiaA [Candidatus Paceibacterota bacterium]
MKETKPKIVAIVGATASGKTSLSIDLAKEFSGEIISADSRQVYKELDIGTAKVTQEEMSGVPHHLIDVVNVDTVFTAHDFKTLANQAITDIQSRNKLPIIVGGTFFYLDQLRGTSGVADVEPNPELRAELEQLSLEELRTRVATFDRTLLETLEIENPRRLMRAIEILEALGHIPKPTVVESPYDWLIIGLSVEKEELRSRYRTRATSWLEVGFLDEISTLLKKGVSEARLQEIGFEYTLGLSLLKGEITETEFIDKFEQKNWQYAKRQLLWLKRDSDIKWFKPEQRTDIFTTVESFLHN